MTTSQLPPVAAPAAGATQDQVDALQFVNVAAMVASIANINGQRGDTLSYYAIDDGGGNQFVWRNSGRAAKFATNPEWWGGFAFDSDQAADAWWEATSKSLVNALQWGALGDDSTDNTVAFRSMTDYLAAAGGGALYVPVGTYLVRTGWQTNGDSIEIPSNTLIYGDGHTSILKAWLEDVGNGNDAAAIIRLNDRNDSEVRNLHLIGDLVTPLTGEFGYGIAIHGGNRLVVRDVYVEDCWGDGLLLEREKVGDAPAVDVKILNVTSRNNRRQGLTIAGATNFVVANSVLTENSTVAPAAGIDIEPITADVKHGVITGCHFANQSQGVIMSAGSAGSEISDIVISDCTFEEHSLYDVNLTATTVVEKITVSNCWGVGAAATSAAWVHVANNCLDITISGGGCRGDYTFGVDCDASSSRVSISDVSIRLLRGAGNTTGLDIASDDVVVANARIYECQQDGISVTGDQVTLTSVLVDGTERNGINAAGGADMIIEGGRILNTKFAGIEVDNGDVTAHGLFVENCGIATGTNLTTKSSFYVKTSGTLQLRDCTSKVSGTVLTKYHLSTDVGAGAVTTDQLTLIGDPLVANVRDDGGVVNQVTVTLAALATVLDVRARTVIVTGDVGGNTIATITGPLAFSGSRILLRFLDSLVTITDNDAHAAESVDLVGAAADFVSAADTELDLYHDGTSWREISRSVN